MEGAMNELAGLSARQADLIGRLRLFAVAQTETAQRSLV